MASGKTRSGNGYVPGNRKDFTRFTLWNVFETIRVSIQEIGLPATILFVLWWSIDHWSTSDQKARIIELYVLGTGLHAIWPMVVCAVLAVLACVAIFKDGSRKRGKLQVELDRVVEERNSLQEKLLGRKLQHSDARNK